MKVGLKVLAPFRQGVPDPYVPGKFVPDDHWQAWEAHTLANRLQNKWVAWEPIPEDGTDETAAVDISQLDKEGLLEFAAQRFDARLDGRSSEKTLRQQIGAMIDREKAMAAKQGGTRAVPAARSGESATTVGVKAPAQSPAPGAGDPPPPPPAGDENDPTGSGSPPPAP